MHKEGDCDEKAGFTEQQTPAVVTPVTGVAANFLSLFLDEAQRAATGMQT